MGEAGGHVDEKLDAARVGTGSHLVGDLAEEAVGRPAHRGPRDFAGLEPRELEDVLGQLGQRSDLREHLLRVLLALFGRRELVADRVGEHLQRRQGSAQVVRDPHEEVLALLFDDVTFSGALAQLVDHRAHEIMAHGLRLVALGLPRDELVDHPVTGLGGTSEPDLHPSGRGALAGRLRPRP